MTNHLYIHFYFFSSSCFIYAAPISCISFKTLTLTCPLPSSGRPTAASVPVVSESEFHSLPSYLRLMTLHNLNQAIHNINKFTAECPGQCYSSLTIKVNRLGCLVEVVESLMIYLCSWTHQKHKLDVTVRT